MKNIILSFIFLFAFAACDTSDAPEAVLPDEPGSPAVGAITPIGEPVGEVVTATIGPAGGTIESADKRISILIPAHALPTEQQISIQPVSNQCPAGTGNAFRLSPHGIQFAKPASITFHYHDSDTNGSAAALLGIAYQNGQGVWQAPAVRNLDTTARAVTVETTHFSDWGLFQKMYISPGNTTMSPGEEAHLIIREVYSEKVNPLDEVAVPMPKVVDAVHIKRWELRGEGVLTHQNTEGRYYAPSQTPTINPAVVTVHLHKSASVNGSHFKDLRLVGTILVAPEGITVKIGSSSWRTYAGGAVINRTKNIVSGKEGALNISVGWVGNPTGTFRWTNGLDVNFSIVNGLVIHQHLYGRQPLVSNGSLNITRVTEEWVEGFFTVEPAGWIDATTPPIRQGIDRVEGIIRVKRTK